MCGRTSLAVPRSTLESRFDATATAALEPSYNVAPSEDLAVITGDDPDRIGLAQWGLVPEWVDEPASFGAPINARGETLTEKPSFRDAYESRPCLVPVDGFYEWERGRGASQPHRVTLADGGPFALAGLWEQHPKIGRTVTVVTTAANDRLSAIHDRMPVVLAPDEERTWLHESPEARADLIDPFPSERTRSHPVSTAVNDPENDGAAVAERVAADRQSGLGEFGG